MLEDVPCLKNPLYIGLIPILQIIMRLPDDAEVSDELWDDVIECMKQRVGDKFPIIRTYAVRALSRFSSDSENSDILDILLQALPLEQNAVSVYSMLFEACGPAVELVLKFL